MTVKIPMPALSPTMTEGSLTKWLIKVGDQVKIKSSEVGSFSWKISCLEET